MNLQDVIRIVNDVEARKGDDESAHSLEDDLHQSVLAEVALGNPQSKAMAKEALKTLEIKFSRWCA